MTSTINPSDVKNLIGELRTIIGDVDRVTTSPSILKHHGKDESYHKPCPPDAVVFARHTEEVSKVVSACSRYQVPVIPFGVGTSLEGHVCAINGGICLDLSGMNQILEVNTDDLDATVQAGVSRDQLNQHLKDTGLFFPMDPGANATLGGMAATRASGTNAVRYGTMRENTMGLTVVLPDGRIITTGGHARKSSAGYDLTRLIVGSEGTLGVITEVTVRLHGIPESIAAAVCNFPTIENAVDTVILTIQSGIPIARIELLDEVEIEAVNNYSKLNYAVRPTLFLEFHGSDYGVPEQITEFESLSAEFGGSSLEWTTNTEERTVMWQARHDVTYANLALRPGAKLWATDVCVPISALAGCITDTKRDIEAASFPIALVGHVGDGNFHTAMIIDPDNPAEIEEATELNERLISRALSVKGTCTGEHGIGLAKIEHLQAEHGQGVDVMKTIKLALDPNGIMNPGKIFSSFDEDIRYDG